MRLRHRLALLLLLIGLVSTPGQSLLFPLLFPLSIKITIHSNRKPTPPPAHSIHFEAVPVYREVVVKGSAHISPPVPKYTYGDGTKYGTSFANGHVKVYTEEPHTRPHKYATVYSSGGSIDGHFSVSSKPLAPPTHYKGTAYDDSDSHYKGVPYPHTHYKGSSDGTHYKGSEYEEIPQTHYKGSEYEEIPQTHYKGTGYEDTPQTHYKGTGYEDIPQTHYKGTTYEEAPGHYKGKTVKSIYNPHSYIKTVGGYKLSDYISPDKVNKHPEEDVPYTAVPLGKTYAEISAAHKASYNPKAHHAEQYTDIGVPKYHQGYEHDPSYIDDSMPAYKSSAPRPQYRYHHQESASRFDGLVPAATETKVYAGFGTSVYGDSYAKIVYVPRNLRISIRAYRHK